MEMFLVSGWFLDWTVIKQQSPVAIQNYGSPLKKYQTAPTKILYQGVSILHCTCIKSITKPYHNYGMPNI